MVSIGLWPPVMNSNLETLVDRDDKSQKNCWKFSFSKFVKQLIEIDFIKCF